jgi:hypothetical protein
MLAEAIDVRKVGGGIVMARERNSRRSSPEEVYRRDKRTGQGAVRINELSKLGLILNQQTLIDAVFVKVQRLRRTVEEPLF